jgi:hypothetical protein
MKQQIGVAKYLLILCALLINANTSNAQKSKETISQVIDRLTLAHMGTEDFKTLLKFDKSKATKSQTIAWLTEKLNAYIPTDILTKQMKWSSKYSPNATLDEHYVQTKVIDSRVLIENDRIYIHISTFCSDCEDHKDYDDKVIIRIDDLKTVDIMKTHGDTGLYFETFSESISVNDRKRTIYFLPFTFEKESEIENRLKKAFVHLASFYWKPVKNEPF